MQKSTSNSLVPVAVINREIYILRGQKVMLSSALATLYAVQVKILMQAVKRNASRFPSDFMFQLSSAEARNLKSQFVTSSWGGPRRARPYAFTEQGIAMLCELCWLPMKNCAEKSRRWSASTMSDSSPFSPPSSTC
jgi:hypothetical protein